MTETNIPFIHRFQTDQCKYVYDVNSNEIVRVDEVTYDVLGLIGHLSKQDILTRLANKYDMESILISLGAIEQAQRDASLFSCRYPTEIRCPISYESLVYSLSSELTQLVLIISEECNMRCGYCVYSPHYPYKRGYSNKMMSTDLARTAVDYFLARATKVKPSYISFYGGEPLLNFSTIKDVVGYAKSIQNESEVVYNLTTNGTLFSEANMQFLVDNRIFCLVSLDGPRYVHDRYRRFRNGAATFDTIYEKLMLIKRQYPQYYENYISFSVTLSPPFSDVLAIASFIETSEIFANKAPIVVSMVDPRGTSYYDRFTENELTDTPLMLLCQEYVESFCSSGQSDTMRLSEALFKAGLVNIDKRQIYPLSEIAHPVGMCVPGKRKLVVDPDGNFYPCERCDLNDLHRIGNITSGLDVDRIYQFLTDYYNRFLSDCRTCWALRLCGLCSKDFDLNGELQMSLKTLLCQKNKDAVSRRLSAFCSIVEKNPHAFEQYHDHEVLGSYRNLNV